MAGNIEEFLPPSVIENYKAIGVRGVIPKPFDPLTLSDQIRAMWQDFQSERSLA